MPMLAQEPFKLETAGAYEVELLSGLPGLWKIFHIHHMFYQLNKA